jgi:WD40 repeat protein/serine/threonine protein kinase
MWTTDLESDVGPPIAADQIDRVCDLFEADLKAGRRPNLGEILSRVPTELQATLLRELVLVALEYSGTSPYRDSVSDSTKPVNRSRSAESMEAPNTCDAQLPPNMAPALDSAIELEHADPSRTIGGYELLGELGRGGMGVVYRARQISVGRLVALKIIQASRFVDSDDARRTNSLERFRTEAKAASRLDHENIATVYEVGQFGDHPYYAMRLVEGTSLDKLVQAGPLPADRAVRYLVPIARAIDKLHSTGVVHRDLKPSNILVDEATDTPVLADFGLAKLLDAQQNVTLSDEGFGSPPYMAPEQVLHATGVTGAADIYSLGATLYHLLTGRPPFQAATPAEIARQIIFCEPVGVRRLNSSIARDLETICLKCLEKDEHRRYATAGALANDLQRFIDHRPIVARPPGSVGRLWRWCRRNPAWSVLVVGSIVLLSITAATSTLMYIRERLATTAAERALADSRLNLSNKLFNKSLFVQGANSQASLPWLIECLRLDTGTSRELATRQRIHSVLSHGPDLARIVCHESPISCGTFNFAGDRVLTAGSDGSARIWSTTTWECVQTLKHEAPVRQAAFNHRGDLAVTATDDARAQLWTVQSGQKLGGPLDHPGNVKFAVFSADDEFLVTASSDDCVRVWNTRDGSLHATIGAGDSSSPISCVAISPSGSRGVSFFSDSRALVWNPRTGEAGSFLENPGDVNTAQFSPDGTAIVTGNAVGKAKIWEADSGRLLFEFPHSSAVKQACFTTDGKHVVTVTQEAAFIWSMESATAPAVKIVHEGLKSVALDPTDAAILTVGDDRTVRMWIAQDGTSAGLSFLHAEDVTGAQFSNDGRSVLTFSTDGTARIWNRGDRLRKSRIAGFSSVALVNASVDGKWILAFGEAGTGEVFRANAPDMDHAMLKHDEEITAACISPDSQRIAAADALGNLIIWNRATGDCSTYPLQHKHAVRAICFAPDGLAVAAGDETGNVTLCDVDTGKALKSFSLSGAVIAVAFSPRGDLLLAADSKAARLIPLDSRPDSDSHPIQLGGDVLGTRFSPDGNFIVIHGNANRVLVWDIAHGSLRSLPTGSRINDACFSRNSSGLLTVAQDGTAQIWHVWDGTPAHEPIMHSGPLILGAFNPDGQSVALCGADGTARIWRSDSAQPVTIRLHHAGRIVHAQFVAPRQLLTVTEQGDIRVIDAAPSASGIEDLETVGMVRCGHSVDSTGKVVPLSRSEFVRRCRELAGRSGN